jgi:hypothetical protein
MSGHPALDQGKQDVGVEQQPHRSTGGPKQEVLGQRLVEVIGDIGYDGLDAMLPLEFVDRLKAKALARLVRHEVKGRAPVAGDDNRFAPFHLAGELGQAVLCVADRYGLHACCVATNSHKVNTLCHRWPVWRWFRSLRQHRQRVHQAYRASLNIGSAVADGTDGDGGETSTREVILIMRCPSRPSR